LMDCQMPYMDGLTATRVIRRAGNGVNSEATIIGVTSSESYNHCVDAGMNAFLPKPLSTESLSRAIAQLGTRIASWGARVECSKAFCEKQLPSRPVYGLAYLQASRVVHDHLNEVEPLL